MVVPKKSLMVILAIAAMMIVSACSAPDPATPAAPGMNDQPTMPEEPVMPEPEPQVEVQGAVINGVAISSQEVAAIQQQFAMQGMQVNAEQALEQAINQELLRQAIEAQGVTLSDEEVEAEITALLGEQGGTLDDWRAQIEAQGMSYEDALAEVKEDFLIQIYLDTVFAEQDFAVTSEDVQAFYDAQLAMNPELPPLDEEVEMEIRMLLEQEAQQEALQAHLNELRNNAEVVVE